MSYRSERFNRAMRSVEESANGIDMAKWRTLSDRGIGVERMIDSCDYDAVKTAREDAQYDESRSERLFDAEMRLADAGKSYLIRVLLLIVENGADREISLRSVPRRTYFRHRDELLSFFSWHSSAHGYIEGHAMPRPVPVQR